MASITQTKKKAWSTPVLRRLSGRRAEEARNLILAELEVEKKASSRGSR